jgi:hypothetical protein
MQHVDELGGFFTPLRAVVDLAYKAQQQLDRKLATRFSVFDVILRREPQLSDLLRFLFDPAASHGQGTTFLNAFLDCFPRLQSIPRFIHAITREYGTREGRSIDIVIEIGELDSRFAIGIENKPWYLSEDRPMDLENQVKDYCADLEYRFPQRWAFIYLSGGGFKPSTCSIPIENWQRYEEDARCFLMSFARLEDPNIPSVIHWLENCRHACEAEPVRLCLNDMIGYIERFCHPVEENPTMVEQQIEEYVLQNSKILEIAENVHAAMPKIHERLLGAFLADVKSRIHTRLKEEDGWRVEIDPSDERYANTVDITHNSWPPDCAVGLSPFQPDRRQVVLGVWDDPNSSGITKDQRQRLSELLSPDPHGLRKSQSWYSAYEYLSDLRYPLGDFSGREFFEHARRILYHESSDTLGDDLATRLADAALEANKVLGSSPGVSAQG